MSVWSSTIDVTTPNVYLGSDQPLFKELWDIWRARSARNAERSVYYDGEAALKDFGISLPPQMSHISAALGWTAKGVHAVTDRSNFEGFVDATGSDDPFDLSGVLDANDFVQEFKAARVSSAIHGCAFLTVARGDVASGEPEILILAASADRSAAIWDRRSRSLKAFMTVGSTDESGSPEYVTVYSRSFLHNITKSGDRWVVDSRPNPTRMVTVAPLVYGYELRRPLGHSRITRASMGFVDAALRTIVRAEVSSEFYSAPEYWLFGSDVSQFSGGDRWSAVMGRIKALDVDSIAGEKVDLHRFTGASPQPHTDQLRMWQSLFADDQDLEVKFADSANPSSADAIFAAKETLITTTRDANRSWERSAVKTMRFVDLLRRGSADMSSLSAQFTDPAIVSPSSRAAAFASLAQNIDGFGSTEVGMEYAGLTREQISRFKAEKQRADAGSRLEMLAEAAKTARADGTEGSSGDALNEANVLKAKADALGVLRRAGVDADVAARIAGLEGVKFIPGQPITIKAPAEE